MIVTPGSTSVRVRFTVLDSDGNPLTTADNTTLTLSYLRDGAAAATSISLSAGTVGTYSSGGVKHVANGVYELGMPDAAFAVGVRDVELFGTDTNGQVIPRTFKLECTYNGKIWIDTVNGVAGTVPGYNGSQEYPCASYANAVSLAAAMKITTLHVAAGSSITINSGGSYTITGSGWTGTFSGAGLAAGTLIVEGAASIGGSASFGDNTSLYFRNCYRVTSTGLTIGGVGIVKFHNCEIGSLIVDAVNILFTGCGAVPRSGGSSIDLLGANVSVVSFGDFAGIFILKMAQGVAYHCGSGPIQISVSSTGGTLYHSRQVEIDDQASGAVATVLVEEPNQTDLDLADGGRLDVIVDAALADTNELQAYGGSLWMSGSGSAGTTPGTHGTRQNPSNSPANLKTLAAALNIYRLTLLSDDTFDGSIASQFWDIDANHHACSISASGAGEVRVRNADGCDSTTGITLLEYVDSFIEFVTFTGSYFRARNCTLDGDFSFGLAETVLSQCHKLDSGNDPISGSNITLGACSGVWKLDPIGGTIRADFVGSSEVEVSGSGGGTVYLSGPVVWSLAAGSNVTVNDDGVIRGEKIHRWLGALAGKTPDAATRAEINATMAGAGYNETTDSLEAQAGEIAKIPRKDTTHRWTNTGTGKTASVEITEDP